MSDLDRLFQAWLSGPLSEEDGRRLQELLADPAQRRRWRALADLEGALAERGAAVAREPAHASPHTTRRLRRQRPAPRRWWPLALAAGLLLAVGAGWLLRPQGEAALPTLEGRPLARGLAVEGPATLQWTDGSEAILAAASRARVAMQGKGLDLEAGSLAVQVASQPRGRRFTVRTSQALTEVVGTRFRLRCEAGLTALQVEEGAVLFTPVGEMVRTVGAGGSAEAGQAERPVRGLVAWWPLDEGGGGVARDASGQGHEGRISGAAWTPEGLLFRGGDDHVAIAPAGRLASLHEGDYSIAAWFRPAGLPPRGDQADPAVSRDGLAVIAGRTGWTLGLHLGPDGRFFMQHFLADRSPCTRHAPTPAQVGRWHHLVGVVDRRLGRTQLAVDGVVEGYTAWKASGTAAFAYDASHLWRIGISSPGLGACRWPARGLIREVRLYDRALETEEIARLAASR